MNKLLSTAVATLFALCFSGAQAATPATPATPAAKTEAAATPATPATPADASCEAKAVGKNGKPLAGAAKNAFMKKCQAGGNSCEAKAIDKNGKALAGAAKNRVHKEVPVGRVSPTRRPAVGR